MVKAEKNTSPKAAPKKVAPKKAVEKVEAPKKVAPKATEKKVEAPKKAATTPKRGTVVNPATGGVGRRKSSVARAWLTRGTASMMVNGREFNEYFTTEETRLDAVKALKVCSELGNYKVIINVKGGGPVSQAGAIRLGIARALLADNDGHKASLKEHGLLTVDSRVKERKKPGQKGARAKFQFVKR
jgi:small subunit ribosomal protein S9